MSADYFWHLAHKLFAESRASGKKKKNACYKWTFVGPCVINP